MPETTRIGMFLERMATARGVSYYAALSALKAYLETIDNEVFEYQCRKVENPMLYRYLIAAGLPMDRLDILAKLGRGEGGLI